MSQLFSLIWDCFLHPFCKAAPQFCSLKYFSGRMAVQCLRGALKQLTERGESQIEIHVSLPIYHRALDSLCFCFHIFTRGISKAGKDYLSPESFDEGLNLTLCLQCHFELLSTVITLVQIVSVVYLTQITSLIQYVQHLLPKGMQLHQTQAAREMAKTLLKHSTA